jgi:hypothetical protein
MATLLLGMRPANPVACIVAAALAISPAAAISANVARSAPIAANDDHIPCWTADIRARRIFASFTDRPPAGEWKRQTFGFSTDRWFEYVGYRVEALAAIHMEHGERVHAAYMARGEAAYPAFNAWCRAPSVTDAIDAALSTATQEG